MIPPMPGCTSTEQRAVEQPAVEQRAATQVVLGVAGLVVVDLAGGAVAIAHGVNTPGEAWGSRALLAAPLPMIGAQVLLASAGYRWRDRRGMAAAGLLSLACLVSAASGFFDGGLGNPKVPEKLQPVQWVLVGATAAVGGLAARYAFLLRRRRGTAG